MYIRLPRSALTRDIYSNPDLARLFVYILSLVDAEGTATLSVRTAASATGLTERKVITNLRHLQTTHKTTQQTTHKTTQITLCDTASTSRRATQRTTQQTTHKTTQQKFIPPTPEEAQEYIDQMDFHWGAANDFIDFYQQRGWRLKGGDKMVDWKAAMRNWENRWKKVYGTKYKAQLDPRRSTDVGDHTSSDYTGAF